MVPSVSYSSSCFLRSNSFFVARRTQGRGSGRERKSARREEQDWLVCAREKVLRSVKVGSSRSRETQGGDSGAGASDSDGSTKGGARRVPVLYTGSVLFPTEESAFVVRDPPLVLMFQSGVGVNGWFGHCLHKSNAPEAVRDAEFVSSDDVKVGLKGPGITVGCVCEVKQIEDLENNQIKVSYKCIRRIRVLDYCVEKSLFPEVEFEWLDDFESQQDEHVNKTEVLLWECLLEISKLEKKLGKSLSSLPKSLIEVAPSRAQGVPNGTRAEKEKNIWLGRTEAKKPPTVNSKQNDSSSKQMSPYQVIGENSYKYQRQELFSFAAASLVAESVNERLALLTSRNTRAKLEWTLASAEPYLEQLRTEFGIYNALK